MNVYQIVTDRILETMKQGHIPWLKPWTVSLARNLVSKKAYRGINQWLLTGGSPYWLTYKQAVQLGGNVRKGEHGSIVVFWNMLKGNDKNGKDKTIPFLRYYTVFNATQCDGIDYPKGEEKREILECSKIVENMVNRPIVKHIDMNRAYYSPKEDAINMPMINNFKDVESYHATLFHELIHATGHKERLNREGIQNFDHFGSANYSKEELIAEIGSAFLCHKSGIEKDILDHVGYIQSWMRVLSNDDKLIISASAKAQKACEYILGENEEEKHEET